MKTTIVTMFVAMLFACPNLTFGQTFSKKNVRFFAPKASPSFSMPGVVSDEVALTAAYKQEEAKLTYKNLRLYPIVATETYETKARSRDNYITLKEALKDNKAVVAEKGSLEDGQNNVSNRQYADVSGATVNSLDVHNTSGDTLFIMAGEVVTGGKQDRVIAQDITIPPDSSTDIGVYCVEQSRWSGNSGKFDGYFSVSQMELRKVVTEDASQQKVWSKVDEITKKNSAETGTHTYAAVGKSKTMTDSIKGYMEFFKNLPEEYPNTIGVIVITGDKIAGCDLFANSGVFKDQYASLLKSYAMEAENNGATPTADFADARDYFDKLIETEEEEAAKAVDKSKYKKMHLYKYD